MAFDGVAIASVVSELQQKILGGRIDKIYQPEKEEIIINIRNGGNDYKLLLTASPSHPRLHITKQQKANPMTAPLFCMVLRKHLAGGRIVSAEQAGLERIVEIVVESPNEMGDLTNKKIIVEIMGKHSNIILVDTNGVILDSAKRVTHETSAVREVLPGKAYAAPPNQNKLNPLLFKKSEMLSFIHESNAKIGELLYMTYSGISPFLANAVCFGAKISEDFPARQMSAEQKESVCGEFEKLIENISARQFSPKVLLKSGKPFDFCVTNSSFFEMFEAMTFDETSAMLDYYYGQKDINYRMAQKTTDLRKLLQTKIERCVRKKDLHLKTLKDVQNRDAIKIKGELLTANIYSIEKGMTSFTTANYYDEAQPDITIALDPTLTPAENAQKYFKKYNKEKRSFAAANEQLAQTESEMEYLESILQAIDTCEIQADIEALRDELIEQGFLRKRKSKKEKTQKSKPMRFLSSDGFQIYVGKNNTQNDELTLKFAENGDMWFHTKDIAGSHVIVKTEGKPLPDATRKEAASLAAFYSKGKNSSNVPVDYTMKKFVKKPSGAKPGMVIYDKHQTAYMTPDESFLKTIRQI